MTLSALTESGRIINSIKDLQVKSEIPKDTESVIIENKGVNVQNDISSLIAAKAEYENNESVLNIEPIFIVDPFHKIAETVVPNGEDPVFETFLKNQDIAFITGEKSTKIRLNRPAKKDKKVNGTRGTIGVNIITGTTISSRDGDIIDPAQIDIAPVSSFIQIQADNYRAKKDKKQKTGKDKKIVEDTTSAAETFEFGIPGKHLIFSSPVAISIATPNYSDGITVDLAVLHQGDTIFNTSGLSTSPNTLCNPDGSASKPGSLGIVKNGKVTFYTCGASSFTMNPTGGTAGSNDLKLIVGDCAQTQIYYNNQQQIYTGNPPATGCSKNGTMDSWPALRIGNTTYGNDFGAWTTSNTVGSTNGNTYTATSTMTRKVGGRTYTVIIDWEHTVPNKYLTWSYQIIVPAGNTQNIRFYYGMDSYVAGADANDTGYYTNTGGQTVGIYDNVANIVSAFRYIDGPAWTGYQANGYNTVRTQIANGANFTNNIQTTGGDLGFGINWDFGTTANVTYSGTVEWRLLPYVAANVPDLIPGIGQPEGPLTTGYLSQLPIILTNAGNLSSSGVHTVVLTLPTTISGPASSFTDNGWACGAQAGTTVTCTKTTNIAPLDTDTVQIPVIPLPAAGGTNVTFNVSVSNPSDSNTSNNTAFATNAVVTSTLIYAPGGVTGMTFWAKANGGKNCTIAGCTITTWSNSGTLGAGANAVTGLGTVTYDPNNSINYNPTLYFNNASLNTNSNLSIITAAASIFTMTKLGTGGIFRIGTQTATNNALDWSTLPTLDRLARYNSSIFYNTANGRSVGTSDITSTSRATGGTAVNRTNGVQMMTNAAIANTFTSSSIGIGRTVATNSTFANVGEVIIYPSEIIGVNRNKVETYLAIKYGNTLDQTTPQNYTLSNNSVAWDNSIAGSFNQQIAGIARDDISSLNQIKSQSSLNTGDIIVNSTTPLATNLQSLIWGNNGDTAGTYSAIDTPLGYQRINREWQFQEKNGDTTALKIAYPASALPSGGASPLYMFVDDDGVFATSATAYTGTLNTGNWEFTVNISDMQYITFGQPGDLIAPTIASVSLASGSLLPIGNFPLTIGYSDTGSLINTASFTGKIYSWDGVSAWNTTNLAPSYMNISGTPNSTTGALNIAGLPFGKYRFDISVADNAGNVQTKSYTYFVDAIEWSVSSAIYDIGSIPSNVQVFGSGTMTVTVKTVGAAFSVKVVGSNTLAKGPDIVGYWDGIAGWGYDSGGSTLVSIGSTVVIGTQTSNINQNGIKNTYTYPIKYGGKINAEMVAGIYNGTIKLDLIANY